MWISQALKYDIFQIMADLRELPYVQRLRKLKSKRFSVVEYLKDTEAFVSNAIDKSFGILYH